MMSILNALHRMVDGISSWFHLARNSEFGWPTLDRRSRRYKREQQSLWEKLKLLILFNPIFDWFDHTSNLRLWLHEKTAKEEERRASYAEIKSFVEHFGIDMDEFDPSDIEEYKTFDDFLTRKHKAGARPIHEQDNSSKAVIVADSRVVVYPTVAAARSLWIKGKNFTISDLIQNKAQSKPWTDGPVASFRLSPQDCHRYHSPVTGVVKWYKEIPGGFYPVDPICLQSDADILTRNSRCCLCIETKDFGDVLFVAVGTTDVGDTKVNKQMQQAGHQVNKGDEIGLFQFGGSSVILAFEKGRIEFDEDLLKMSEQNIMVDVKMGMSMGRAPAEVEML